jgi:hypothetical protein
MNNLIYSVLISAIFAGLLPLNTDLLLQDDHTDKITQAITKGNADALSEYFSASIDLKIPGSEGTFSKNQATVLIKEFFSAETPESFTLGHKGSSQDGSIYIIGHTKTAKGKNYRTYILLKNISGKMVLHQLQFDSR